MDGSVGESVVLGGLGGRRGESGGGAAASGKRAVVCSGPSDGVGEGGDGCWSQALSSGLSRRWGVEGGRASFVGTLVVGCDASCVYVPGEEGDVRRGGEGISGWVDGGVELGRSLGGDVRVGGWDPGRVVAGRAVGLRSPGGVTAGRVGVVGATRCFLFLRVGRRYVRRERCFWSTPWRFGSRSRVFRHCFLPPRLHPVHACPLAKQGHPARFAVGREQHVLFGEQLQQAGLDASRVAFGCFVGRRGVVRTGEG